MRSIPHSWIWLSVVYLFVGGSWALTVSKEIVPVAKGDISETEIILDTNPLSTPSNPTPVGTIVGGTVGGVAAVLILGALALYLILRRSKSHKRKHLAKHAEPQQTVYAMPTTPQPVYMYSRSQLHVNGVNGVPAVVNGIPVQPTYAPLSPTTVNTSPYSPLAMSPGARTSSPVGSTHSLSATARLPSSTGHAMPVGVAMVDPAMIIEPFTEGLPTSPRGHRHDRNPSNGSSVSSRRGRMNPPSYSDIAESLTQAPHTRTRSKRYSLGRTKGKGSISKRSVDTSRSIHSVMSEGSQSHIRGASGGSTTVGGGTLGYVRSVLERRNDHRHRPAV